MGECGGDGPGPTGIPAVVPGGERRSRPGPGSPAVLRRQPLAPAHREFERPSGAVVGADLRAAADLFHQTIDQPQTVPLAPAFGRETDAVVTQSDRGLVGGR